MPYHKLVDFTTATSDAQPELAAIPAHGLVCRLSMPTGRDSVLFADNSVDFSRFSVDPDEAWLEQPLFAGQLRPPMGFPIGGINMILSLLITKPA